MELSEALKTIGATIGMFSQFLCEIENDENFISTPVKQNNDTHAAGIPSKEYYDCEENGKSYRVSLVDITPVCEYVAHEWPSPQAKKIRERLDEVYRECMEYCSIKQLRSFIDIATNEEYKYTQLYESVQESRTIVNVIMDTIYEMYSVLGLTKGDDLNKKTVPKVAKKTKPIKSFSDFIIDAERTDEIMGKLHRLIGNKTNTDALRIITRAMWIEWIERPTAPSIKNEFPTITCSSTIISRCLNEAEPILPKNAIEIIRQKFEAI